MVALLTNEQREQLQGVEVVADNYFNPIKDANDNWIISIEELDFCNIEWVKELPQIEYIPKVIE